MKIEVSYGELFDKLSILEIKSEKIKDEEKLKNVNYELAMLDEVRGKWSDWHDSTCSLYQELLKTNKELWEVEDKIRALDDKVFPVEKYIHPSRRSVDPTVPWEKKSAAVLEYLFLAREVYTLNDWRAKVKKQINLLNKSAIVEEKSYNKE